MTGESALLRSDRGEQIRTTDFAETPAVASARQRAARFVVLGEFNSGKTSLVNSLVGAPLLPASFTTHTAYPTVVGFAAKPSLRAEVAGRRRVPFAWERIDGAPAQDIVRLHVGVPLDRLKTVRVIDTPGLGLGDESREARTLRACRGAETVIWCTPAMQAWKASELRVWLGLSKTLRQRGVLAVTFMDQIRTKSDANRLLARLRAEAGPLFRKIVPISAPGIVALSDGDIR
jgi:GTPase Era involved in 16S rRNA processing